MATTIKLDKKTKSRLDKLRTHKRETYDEVVQSMLNILNLCRVSPERARAQLIFLDRIKRKGKPRASSSVKLVGPQRSLQSYSETH